MKPALIYNADIRNNGTPVYFKHAFDGLFDMPVSRYRPAGEIPKHDFYIYIDDGRDGLEWDTPRPCGYYAIDTHLGWDWRRHKAEKYDVIWCAQKPAAVQMKKEGLNAKWLPLACSPLAHPTAEELKSRLQIEIPEKSVDVGFVGFMQDPASSNRVEFLDAIFKAIPNFHFAFGVFHEDMAKIYHKAKIGINHAVRDDLNMRFFELASIGVPQLCDRRMKGLFECGFHENEHFIGYSSAKEAIAQAKKFLTMPSMLQIMAERALTHVRAKHTYTDRAKEMISDAREIVTAYQKAKYSQDAVMA